MPNQEQLEVPAKEKREASESVSRPNPWWMAIIATLAFLLWFILRWFKVTEIDALFAGLALAALWFTIWQQNADLRIQAEELRQARNELELTREEVTRQREAMEAQAAAMERQVEVMAAQFNYLVSQDAPELRFRRLGITPLPGRSEKVEYELTNYGGLAQDLRIECPDDSFKEFHLSEDTLDTRSQCDAWCNVRTLLEEDIYFVLSCRMGNGRPVRFDGSFHYISREITLKRREIPWRLGGEENADSSEDTTDPGKAGDEKPPTSDKG